MIVLSVTLYIFALHPIGYGGLWPWLQLDFTVDGLDCFFFVVELNVNLTNQKSFLYS